MQIKSLCSRSGYKTRRTATGTVTTPHAVVVRLLPLHVRAPVDTVARGQKSGTEQQTSFQKLVV